MNFEPLEKIANAVLYEGFLLYPYRKSSVKNQQRWHFGTVGPAAAADANVMQTECLVEGDAATAIDLKVRFLQQEIEREIELSSIRFDSEGDRRMFSFPPIQGKLEVTSSRVSKTVFRLQVRIENASEGSGIDHSMASTHTLLGVGGGAFLSLLDPPEEYRVAAAACRNIGTWPVLAGREGDET